MKVVFLDRDGVINEFPGNGNYVTKVKDFRFIPRALEALKILTEQGFIIFVVSNQAGVGKGIFSKNKLDHITKRMLEKVKNSGGKIKRVFYCTHTTDDGCDCRKPQIGFIRRALRSMNKNIRGAKRSFFIGDTRIDVLTGHKAGCKTIFVLSGRENHEHLIKDNVKPDFITKDLLQAAKIIKGNHHKK